MAWMWGVPWNDNQQDRHHGARKNRPCLSYGILVLLIFTIICSVEAGIKCHYCGTTNLCPLPYYNPKEYETKAGWITCPISCLKFDGYAEDGKRVIVRDCGEQDSNECNQNEEYNGGTGQLCYCTGPKCNGAESSLSRLHFTEIICFALMATIIVPMWFSTNTIINYNGSLVDEMKDRRDKA